MRKGISCIFMLLAVVFYVSAAEAKSDGSFRWLSRKADPALWSKVEQAFVEELSPDDPVKVAPVVAYSDKYVERVGVHDNQALIVIGHRETRTDKSGDYFTIFNFDLTTGAKQHIQSSEAFWKWKFLKLARFEAEEIPDVVFTYFSCTECESEHLLSALRFDSGRRSWGLRQWSDRESAIFIGSDPQYVEEGTEVATCAFAIDDYDHNGVDELAVRCSVTVTDDTKRSVSKIETRVWSVKKGEPSVERLKGTRLAQINSAICESQKTNPLCHQSQQK